MKQVLISVLLLGFLAGCGGLGNSSAGSAGSAGSGSASSGGSSGSSFGGNRQRKRAVPQVDKDAELAGGRTIVSVLKEARVERTRDGAIVHATALAPRQGYYDAVLFENEDVVKPGSGVLILEFRAREPQFQTNVSTERSRLISTGVFLSNQTLAAASRIVVVGRRNQIVLRQ
ncbi:MAG: hypothetical protein AAF393_14975 [Pseudomonadota bacterium]